MGARVSRTGTSTTSATSKQSLFKLFEYQCPNCKSKRPIQYFYKEGVFLPQVPRVVCGSCNNSVAVQPFKTVDFCCPPCGKWQKVRLPAKPIPVNMYNRSVATCNCGFRGEVPVGRLMDVSCGKCWKGKRELRDVWTEDGDEVKTYCEPCQDYQRSFAKAPQKKGATEPVAELEYTCENCFRIRPLRAEELLRNQGLAFCSLCGWVGHAEVHPHGRQCSKPTPQAEGGEKPRGKPKKPKRSSNEVQSLSVVPTCSNEVQSFNALPDGTSD